MLNASNPELLIVGNPKKRRGKKRKHSNKRISYRGKQLYYIQLMRKLGKVKASKIWRRRFPIRIKGSKKIVRRGRGRKLTLICTRKRSRK